LQVALLACDALQLQRLAAHGVLHLRHSLTQRLVTGLQLLQALPLG